MTISMGQRFSIMLILVLSLSGCASFKPAMKASPTLANAMGVAEIPIRELKRTYVDEDSQFIEVNGLEIHYQDVGEGPVIVLLHGVMSSLHTWDGWVEELSKNFRVITLDLPGFGLTPGPENLDEFDEQYVFNMFAKFIDNMELEQVSLAGNSFGGYIAARYAAFYPQRVEKLILIDPWGYPQELPLVFKMANMPVVGTMGNLIQPPVLVTKTVRELYGDPSRLEQWHLYRYVHLSQRPRGKKLNLKTLRMLGEASQDERPLPFASISSPTLLMWGAEDKWISPELAKRWQADIRNLKYIAYPGVGHLPMEEVPYQTANDAIEFLADLQPAPIEQAPSMDDLESILQGDDFSSDFEVMEEL